MRGNGTIQWRSKDGAYASCGITLSRLRPGANADGVPYCIQLRCGHAFYRSVLYHWWQGSNTCPMCRRPIELPTERVSTPKKPKRNRGFSHKPFFRRLEGARETSRPGP